MKVGPEAVARIRRILEALATSLIGKDCSEGRAGGCGEDQEDTGGCCYYSNTYGIKVGQATLLKIRIIKI